MADWKPIDSAPKDGTPIRVRFPDNRTATVKWWTSHKAKRGSQATQRRDALIERHGGYWGSAGLKSKPCKRAPVGWCEEST